MLTGFFKFFIALNGNQNPSEISSGIAYGFWLALLPINSLLWVVLLIMGNFFKINQAALLLTAFLLKLVIFPLTPLLDYVGWFILSQDALFGFFSNMRNVPLIPWTRFYNSVVMGALVLGPFLAIPVGIMGNVLVKLYRRQLRDRLLNSKLIRALKNFPLVRILMKNYQGAKKIMSVVR